VLIADADESFARDLARALSAERTIDVVAWATGAEQTLELAREQAPDAVLLALELPGALTILEPLAAIEPKRPKVILTGMEDTSAELLVQASTSAGGVEPAGFVRRTADVSEMTSLVVVVVALANVSPTNDLNGTTV